MKTLKRFWEWHDAEKPGPDVRWTMEGRNVSPAGRESLRRAETEILERLDAFPWVPSSNEPYASHPEALRDLSLALCAALERMHEQVPEVEKVSVELSIAQEDIDLDLQPTRVVDSALEWKEHCRATAALVERGIRALDQFRERPDSDEDPRPLLEQAKNVTVDRRLQGVRLEGDDEPAATERIQRALSVAQRNMDDFRDQCHEMGRGEEFERMREQVQEGKRDDGCYGPWTEPRDED